MQGIFNKQQPICTLPFITSLFSIGPYAKKNTAKVWYRRIVTSSKCTLHHGKGITYRLHEGNIPDYGFNERSPRHGRITVNSKSFKTASWMKKSTSDKSRGSSFSVVKKKNGKTIFRLTRQSQPNVIQGIQKPSTAFKNSIIEVLDSKIVGKPKQILKKSARRDAKLSVDKLNLPHFKDTSIIDASRGKTVEKSLFTMKKSRSTDAQKVVKHSNDGSLGSKLQSTSCVDSHSQLSLPAKTKSGSYGDLKMKKNSPTKQKRHFKKRSKNRLFSSSEMLFPNGVGEFTKEGKSRKDVVNTAHSMRSYKENSPSPNLEENMDSSLKLFVGKESKNGGRKGVVDVIRNCEPNVTVGRLGLVGESPTQGYATNESIENQTKGMVQSPKVQKRNADSFHGDLGSKMVSNDAIAPQTKMAKFRSSQTGDNIIVHRYTNLKRPVNREKIEFDTTIIEKEGKKITKIKPKFNGNLRGSKSDETMRGNAVYLHEVCNREISGSSPHGFSKMETSSKNNTVSEETRTILSRIDPINPKMNWSQIEKKNALSAGKCGFSSDDLVIPQDGNTIFEVEPETVKQKGLQKVQDNCKFSENKTSISKSSLGINNNGFVRDDLPSKGHRQFVIKEALQVENLDCESLPKMGFQNSTINMNQSKITQDNKQFSENETSISSSGLGVNNSGFLKNDLPSKGRHQFGIKEAVQLENLAPESLPKTGLWNSTINMNQGKITQNDIQFSENKTSISCSGLGINNSGFVKNDLPSKGLHQPSIKKAVQVVNLAHESLPKTGLRNSTINMNQSKITQDNIQFSEIKTSMPKGHHQCGIKEAVQDENVALAREFSTKHSRLAQIEMKKEQESAPKDLVGLNQMTQILSEKGKTYRGGNSTHIAMNSDEKHTVHPSFADSFAAVKESGRTVDSGLRNGLISRNVAKMKFNPTVKAALGKQEMQPMNLASESATRIATSQLQDGHDNYRTKNDSCLSETSLDFGIMAARGDNKGVNNISEAGLGNIHTSQSFLSDCASHSAASSPKDSTSDVNTWNVDCSVMPKANFPPACNSCQNHGLRHEENQSCSTNAFPPQCPILEPEQVNALGCSTCKPPFPPPCPPNTCSSQQGENKCYDPCNPPTKSKTHTILDVSDLPRPPIPIKMDCIPKSKPCFPPPCPDQNKNTPKMCQNTQGKITLTWRAYMNHNYWTTRCLLTRMFDRFLALLRAQIMYLRECTIIRNFRKLPSSNECKLTESSVIHRKPTGAQKSGINRIRYGNFTSKHAIKPNPKHKIRKKVRVVKTVRKSVLDDKGREAILKEEQKRKSIGAKATPNLAYSEVLNIVFNQKKSAQSP